MGTSMSALLGAGGAVKSVQRGKSTPVAGQGGTLDITIAPIDPAKTMANLLTVGQITSATQWTRQLSILNATTLRLTSYGWDTNGNTFMLESSWEVIDFK